MKRHTRRRFEPHRSSSCSPRLRWPLEQTDSAHLQLTPVELQPDCRRSQNADRSTRRRGRCRVGVVPRWHRNPCCHRPSSALATEHALPGPAFHSCSHSRKIVADLKWQSQHAHNQLLLAPATDTALRIGLYLMIVERRDNRCHHNRRWHAGLRQHLNAPATVWLA